MKELLVFLLFPICTMCYNANRSFCPIKDGVIKEKKYVYGKPSVSKVIICGASNDKVYSYSSGNVLKNDKGRNIIVIDDLDWKYVYSGVESEIVPGTKVKSNEVIGSLDIGGVLSFSVKKDDVFLNSKLLLDCKSD